MPDAALGSVAVVRVARLPDAALDAAAAFHARWADEVRNAAAAGNECVVVTMHPAPCDHAGWRRAAARDLARAHPDHCISIVAGDDEAAIARAIDFLARSPAITGHYLPLAQGGTCETLAGDDAHQHTHG